jgi:hypothetical protein
MEQVNQILNNVEHFVVKNKILIFVIVAVIVAAFYYNKYYSIDISFENILREPLCNGKNHKIIQ